MPGTWTTLKNKPTFAASTMLLLIDGTVMCQDSGGTHDNTFGEIGDIDNTQVKRVGTFLVQKEWSNRARRPI